jgi:hypothetical protein
VKNRCSVYLRLILGLFNKKCPPSSLKSHKLNPSQLQLFAPVMTTKCLWIKHKKIVIWYVYRAYYNYRQTQTLFNTFNNVESIIASFEAIESSVKAMCKLCDIP